MITIKEAMNGWIVIQPKEVEDDFSDRVYVFSYDDKVDSEVEAFTHMLWQVNELMGPMTSRYSKKRVYIGVKPGDKCEEAEEAEEEEEL